MESSYIHVLLVGLGVIHSGAIGWAVFIDIKKIDVAIEMDMACQKLFKQGRGDKQCEGKYTRK